MFHFLPFFIHSSAGHLPSNPLPPHEFITPQTHFASAFGEFLLSGRAMTGRRSIGSRITEDEVNELISKLQSLLPEARRHNLSQASTVKLLKETCRYIKSLHREVDELSDRLSNLH